jgi:2-methylcitrate dehydratase PrpD
MSRQAAMDAFGHALAFASGTMQAHVEGKPALPVQVGNAARNALVAIDLARGGMPGVAQPIEGPFGYFALLEKESDIAAALDAMPAAHHITAVSCKPFPTGRAGHGGIVAVQRLLTEHDARADTLESLEYHAPPLIHRLVGRPAFSGMAPGYARLCMQWLVAITLTKGTVGLDDFGSAALRDPALLALAAKVRVVADGNPDPAAFVPARAIARFDDGRIAEVAIAAQLGAPEWPFTAAQFREKARACLAFAGLSDRAEPLFAAVAAIRSAPDAVAAVRATGIMG